MYLGRAYFGQRFGLNFTLLDPAAAADTPPSRDLQEDCDGVPASDRDESLAPRDRLARHVAMLALAGSACRQGPDPGTVRDEATRAGLMPAHFVRQTDDYFRDMDYNVVRGKPPDLHASRRSKAGTCGWCGPAATIGCGIG